MAKAATVKDVLYALEFLGAELCMWPSPGGHRNAWSLEPGGVKVPPHVADEARAQGGVVGLPGSKHGEARYGWSEAA